MVMIQRWAWHKRVCLLGCDWLSARRRFVAVSLAVVATVIVIDLVFSSHFTRPHLNYLSLLQKKPHVSDANATVSQIDDPHRVSAPRVTMNYSAARYKITVYFQGGFGNHMFQYASLVGIARSNNLIPEISKQSEINRVFSPRAQLSASRNPGARYKPYYEEKGCTYEAKVNTLRNSTGARLIGYFQSWRYFKHVEEDLRQEFVFHQEVFAKAKGQLYTLTQPLVQSANNTTHTYIAVHVRRGDMVTSKDLVSYGYVTAGKDYLDRAMGHFRQRYPNSTVFVVASNDMKWCQDNLKGDDVVYLPVDNSREVDLAVLSLCNHTVMTVGSFGWWAAWLAGGDVLYYKDYPKPGSKLADIFNSEDYRYPHWLGL